MSERITGWFSFYFFLLILTICRSMTSFELCLRWARKWMMATVWLPYKIVARNDRFLLEHKFSRPWILLASSAWTELGPPCDIIVTKLGVGIVGRFKQFLRKWYDWMNTMILWPKYYIVQNRKKKKKCGSFYFYWRWKILWQIIMIRRFYCWYCGNIYVGDDVLENQNHMYVFKQHSYEKVL